MNLRFEHVVDCDSPLFPAAIELVNASLPTFAMSVEEGRNMDRISKPAQIGQRWIAFFDNKPTVLVGYSQELPTPGTPNSYRIRLRSAPGTDINVLRAAMAFLQPKLDVLGPRVETVFAFSTTPETIEVALEFGYKHVFTNPFTELVLADWEPPFLPNANVTIREIHCTPTGSGPDDPSYYELHNTLMRDVPMPTPYTPEPIEDFFKYFSTPSAKLTRIWVAEHDGRMVGMTEVHQNSFFADMLNTGLTGVRRENRRQGIASSLKVHALLEAKKTGARVITTDNEENNPMLALNKALGFRHTFDGLSFKKEVLS
ncbi:MAG: GNAT family N-acetyltransferase [Fimbriimonadaceae bacterium]|nr:GNAT family N-acetyltransferase [Fimbriimonadaceae bacterium]